jgi:hypothetical protein
MEACDSFSAHWFAWFDDRPNDRGDYLLQADMMSLSGCDDLAASNADIDPVLRPACLRVVHLRITRPIVTVPQS